MREPTEQIADLDAWMRCARHDQLVVLLDLDGTLIPYAETAEMAHVDPSALELLQGLSEAGIQTAIVSGRPRALIEPLRERAPHVWWVAEHGAWRCRSQWDGPADCAAELDELLRALCPMAEIPGARVERKTMSVCVHWRQVPIEHKEALIRTVELTCEEWLEAHPECERIDGVESLEVRRRSAHKGSAVHWVREQLPGAHVLAVGDDVTDEDMFDALGDTEIAIAVGPRRSARALAYLSCPASVRTFLWWLIEVRTRGAERLPPLEIVPQHTRGAKTDLLVVSNRAPDRSTARHRSVSGLISALEPALREKDGIWLGWSGQERDAEPRLRIDDGTRPRRASFDLPRELRDRFYRGLCSRALWPLFHGFPGRVRYASADWWAYERANEIYARFANDLVTDDARIWVHDYHLLLVGRALKARGFRGRSGVFLHTPFPPRDLFETFPWCNALLDGMRDFDLVGFHTEQWAENFRMSLRAQEERGDSMTRRTPLIEVFPLGVDPTSFAIDELALDREVESLRATLGSRRLILGVDRLDYAKGIPERLAAFEHLLEHYPEWRSKVSLVQISVPSRADVPEYAELRATVERMVGRINGQFGEADWAPVRYLYRSYDQHVLAQLYRLADVALVTPLRDGMNLVAKEFVASQDPARPGVLILSRFAGAAAEMTDAVLTNPYHAEGLASDLDRALTMPPEERLRRHVRLAAGVGRSNPVRWTTRFLESLDESRLTRAGISDA